MELHPLRVFLTVAAEKSFSRAAEKLLRTQPAISLSIQRLETELGERLIDRSAKDLLLTDAGKIVLEYARRYENLQGDLENALAELRDKSARLTVGANESCTLYLLEHIRRYRHRFPRVKVQIRRSLSSRIPAELIDGDFAAERRAGERPARGQPDGVRLPHDVELHEQLGELDVLGALVDHDAHRAVRAVRAHVNDRASERPLAQAGHRDQKLAFVTVRRRRSCGAAHPPC